MASRATRRAHLHAATLVCALFVAEPPRAAAQPTAPLQRAGRSIARLVVRDGAGAMIETANGVFLDVGKLVVPRAAAALGAEIGVVVGGAEQRTTAVLAEDPQAGVIVVAVDLPDGGPQPISRASKPDPRRDRVFAISTVTAAAGAPGLPCDGAVSTQVLDLVVGPVRQVPGLGAVRAIESGGAPPAGSAVVNAEGELIGVSVTSEAGPDAQTVFVVPVERLQAIRRVPPTPVLEWAIQARAAGRSGAERDRLRGAAAALAGRFDDAAAAFESAVTSVPTDADAWMALGECRRAQRRPDASVETWRRAVAAQPANPRFHHEFAVDLSDAGRFEQAAAEFGEVARLRPLDAEARFNLGATLGALGRYEEESRAYAAALAIDPSHLRALKNLGLSYLSMKRADEALSAFDRAGRLAPGDPEISTGMGLSYLSANRVAEAIAALKHAVQLAPTFAKARFSLGIAYLAGGDPAAARSECQMLRGLDAAKSAQLCRIVDAK